MPVPSARLLCASLPLALLTGLTLFACGGGSGSVDTEVGDADDGAGSSGGGDGPNGGGGSEGQCVEAEDCSTHWWCECAEGPPVNTRHCLNGRCAHATEICASTCESFGTTWTGVYGQNPTSNDDSGSGGGGGNDGGSNPPSCGAFFATNTCGDCGYDRCCAEGAACDANADCGEIPSCIVACVNQGASQAYCTSECRSYFSSGASAWDA